MFCFNARTFDTRKTGISGESLKMAVYMSTILKREGTHLFRNTRKLLEVHREACVASDPIFLRRQQSACTLHRTYLWQAAQQSKTVQRHSAPVATDVADLDKNAKEWLQIATSGAATLRMPHICNIYNACSLHRDERHACTSSSQCSCLPGRAHQNTTK